MPKYIGYRPTTTASSVTNSLGNVDTKYNSGVWSISNSSGSDYSVYGRKLASIWDLTRIQWDSAISSGLYTIDNGGLDVQKTSGSGWGTCAVLSKLMTTADKFSLDVEVLSYELYNGYGINLGTDGSVVSSPGYIVADVAGRHYGAPAGGERARWIHHDPGVQRAGAGFPPADQQRAVQVCRDFAGQLSVRRAGLWFKCW
jgi:hypothetical protein